MITMTPEQDVFATQLGIILGISYLLIYRICCYFFRKKALKNIKNNLLEGEYIVSEPKFVFVIEYFIPFVIGGFIGNFIIPSFLYPEIERVGLMYRQELYFWIIGVIIVLFGFFWISGLKFVMTNKRMIYALPFKFLYNFRSMLIFDQLYYSDIKTYEYKNVFLQKFLYLYNFKNNKFKIGAFKNLNEFGKIIEKFR